jgi:hypothetical protein
MKVLTSSGLARHLGGSVLTVAEADQMTVARSVRFL